MKKLFLFVTVLMTINQAHATRLFDQYLHDGLYRFDDVFKLLRSDVFTTYKSQFGLTSYDAMVEAEEQFLREDPSDMFDFGTIASRYKQYYKGVEVEQKTFNVYSKCEVVLAISGKVVEDLSIDTTGHIPDSTALDSAMTLINPPLGFTWQNSDYERGLQMSSLEDSTGHYDSTITSYPKGKLIIAKRHGDSYADITSNYALCWKFSISYFGTVFRDSVFTDSVMVYNVTDTEVMNRTVYVNASTGAIWGEYNPSNGDYFTSGNGNNGNARVWHYVYGDQEGIEAQTCNFCPKYRLEDHRDIKTYWKQYSAGNLTHDHGLVYDFDNLWVGGDPYERESGGCHWSVERAFDYFESQQGISHYGSELHIIVNSSQDPFSTHFTPNTDDHSISEIRTGNSNGSFTTSSALDIMGHEFTHHMNYKANKIGQDQFNSGEPLVINEAFADIFGLLTESWVRGSNDWTEGESFWGGVYARRFRNPENDHFPNTIAVGSCTNYTSQTNYYNDFPYSGGGIIRKWFDLLSEGVQHTPPQTGDWTGVGTTIAGRIAFIAMQWGLWSSGNISDLRGVTLGIAETFYGGTKCTDVWNRVEKAWVLVGVGTQSSCNHLRVTGPKVAASDWIASESAHPVKFAAVATSCESGSVADLSYTWNIPEGWSGTTSDDGSSFTLTAIGDDITSKVVSVDVSYADCDGNPVNETLNTVLHITTECNDNPDPGRHANNNGSTVANSTTADIKVRPIPASKQVYVTLPNTIENADGVLQDISGKTIRTMKLKSGENIMPVSGLPSGVYILKVKNKTVNFTKKVIVQQ